MSSKKLSFKAFSLVFVLLLSGNLYAKTKKTKNLIQSIESVQIKSIKQQMLDQHHFVFEEEVEVLVDKTIHIWADRVEVDKQHKILFATSVHGGPVKIETNDFLILADTFTLNVTEKTGSADNIKIHVREGYVAASKAEKLSENRWSMKNIVYTPCDAHHSHWHLSASRAVVHGGIFIKLTGVLFKIMNIPVFGLPYMLFPIQGGSRSGFLIPKFYFDYDFGFGTKVEYYQYFGPRCDTTIGIDWQDRKGFVVSDEFRWARSP
jgi:lipopolysaccharide assembly outer membrane protein LptD (OstA)